ncbi:restriction endonuclease subunit S, partial [Megasphaera stantonii]
DETINVKKNINDNLQQQAQALYKSCFVDFDPYDGIMPSDWIIGTVDDLAKEIVCGKTPSTKISEYYGSEIPFITIPDMHGKIYVMTTERYLSMYGANSQPKKTLPKNSICVSCIGTAGLVSLVASESQTNQQINSIIPKDDYSPYYIYLLMRTLSEVINKLGQGGSTIVNLNKAQFGKIQVMIPTVASMRKFDKTVSPLFSVILENQKENIYLSSLRDTLLPRLMSGELDVSDIQL